jgi:hypothetical protein
MSVLIREAEGHAPPTDDIPSYEVQRAAYRTAMEAYHQRFVRLPGEED